MSAFTMMPGYGALARFMSRLRNQDVFRKFTELNMEIMLHMQAELVHLEVVIREARNSGDIGRFDRSWMECVQDVSQEDIHAVFERARTLLSQYYAAALQTAQINALQKPRRDDLQLRKSWYDQTDGGNDFLRGLEAGIFREQAMEADLMILSENPGGEDPLANFLGDKIVPLYHRILGERIHRSMPKEFGRTWDYPPEILVQIGNGISMVLSAVLPALSILVLFCVQSMAARLTAICLMSLVFSLIMSLVAQRRSEIFMSTTAFAAVLVVFVGGSNVVNSGI